MRKILEMKLLPVFLCQKLCIILYINVLLLNATVGSWAYSQPMLWRAWLSQYWIYLPFPPTPRISEFVSSPIVTWFLLLENLINLHFFLKGGGNSVSRMYGTKRDRLWSKVHISFPQRCRNTGKCFRWNKSYGRPQEQLNVNRAVCSCHREIWTKASALICLHLSVYTYLFIF